MKRIVILNLGILFAMCSTNRHIDLSHRVYIADTPLKIMTLDFMSDSLCLFTQEYLVDMPEEFQRVEIICKYWQDGIYLILENIECPDYLKGLSCYTLPDSIRNKFKPSEPQGIDRLWTLDEREYYGYIDGIKDKDTLQLESKWLIQYFKYRPCLNEDTIHWLHMKRFRLQGARFNEKKSLKTMRKYGLYYNKE
ncbi:MAG: hypothetical protein LUF87_08705 [Alistipes sp.]|nr:hypothetical protein [Alistipes sp.]MCD7970420.1 hypothetical protein [Alistipes sp.]